MPPNHSTPATSEPTKMQAVSDTTGREALLEALRLALLDRVAMSLAAQQGPQSLPAPSSGLGSSRPGVKLAFGDSATRAAVRSVALAAQGCGYALPAGTRPLDARWGLCPALSLPGSAVVSSHGVAACLQRCESSRCAHGGPCISGLLAPIPLTPGGKQACVGLCLGCNQGQHACSRHVPSAQLKQTVLAPPASALPPPALAPAAAPALSRSSFIGTDSRPHAGQAGGGPCSLDPACVGAVQQGPGPVLPFPRHQPAQPAHKACGTVPAVAVSWLCARPGLPDALGCHQHATYH